MSSRIHLALAVLIFLLAAAFRLINITTLPSGLSQSEITDLRIVETIRQGRIEIYYDLNNEVREGLYHVGLAAHVSSVGLGTVSYRILSVWVGMLTLAFTYATGKRLFGPLVGLVAAALLSVNMLAIVLSRTIGPDVLLPGLVGAVLLMLTVVLPISLRWYSRYEGNTAPFAVLGVLLGLGFYIHPVGIMIALASMLFTAFTIIVRRPLSRQTRSYMSFAILVMIIVAMPYLSSSIRQSNLAGANRLIGNFGSLLHSIGDGLAGFVFTGDANPVINLPGRPLIDLVSGLMMLIGIVTAVRYWRQPRFALLLIVTIVLMPTVLLATNAPNFLTFASLLPLVALFFGLGIHTVINSLSPSARRLAAVGFVILMLFNIVWTGTDLFKNWPNRDDVQAAYNSRAGQLAHYLDQTADRIPSVICARDLNNQTVTPMDLSGAQLIALMMNNQSAPVRYVNCGTGLIFTNGGEQEHVILPEADTLEKMPDVLRRWLAYGEVNTGSSLPPDSVITLTVTQPLADTIGLFTTTAPIGYSPEVADSALIAPPVQFGGNLTFLGYEKDDPPVYPPEGVVNVTTYWRIDGLIPSDLTLFVHILADPGAIPVAQTDTISVDPRKMEKRDVFVQVTRVLLPFNIPDGVYSVSIGAYQDQDKRRLDVFDNGEPHGNRLFLYPVTVERNP